MSGPLDAGGRPFTARRGAGAILLTEYAGDGNIVINLSVNDRLWIGGSSDVGPANGVPLEGGTSLPWTSHGQIWAIADAAASADVPGLLTSAVSDYSPSPAALAASVAAKLLATGIPNVLQQTVIASGTLNPANSVNVPVSGYASVSVLCTSGANDIIVSASFFDQTSGLSASTDVIAALYEPPPAGQSFASETFPVTAGTLSMTNESSAAVNYWVLGSNRPAPSPHGVVPAAFSSVGFSASLQHTWAAGESQLLAVDHGELFSGPAYAQIATSGVVAMTGHWFVRIPTAAGQLDLAIADTTEIHADPVSANNKQVYKTIALPQCGYAIGYQSGTAMTGNGTAILRAIPAS